MAFVPKDKTVTCLITGSPERLCRFRRKQPEPTRWPVLKVDNEVGLGDEIARLARDSALRNEMSSNGRQWHQRNQGSSQRIAESIAEKLKN